MVRRPRTIRTRATRRALAVAIVAALLGTLGASPAQAGTAATRGLRLVNRSRASYGLSPVWLSERLSKEAKRHTRRMIRHDRLIDVTNLSQVLQPYNWDVGGAIVGCGSSLAAIHRAFMNDAVHRDIILTASYRRVGIGVVYVAGKSSCGRDVYWVTEIFYG